MAELYMMVEGKKQRRLLAFVLLAASVTIILISVVGWPAFSRWYAFWTRFERLGVNAQGCVEYRHRGTDMVMVLVDPARKGAPELERRLHGRFLIAKYEVDQRTWAAVMRTSPSLHDGPTRPVDGVMWPECVEFCRLTGLSLPTEAQWEYACGSIPAGSALDDHAWHAGNSGFVTHPVGTKEPNGFGLHDMVGNVREFCADIYDTGGRAAEPDTLRVIRGGGKADWPAECGCSAREGGRTVLQGDSLGFRPVYDFADV